MSDGIHEQSHESPQDVDRSWPPITVYGTSWCGDCRRTTEFLTHHSIPFEYRDVDDEGLDDEVIRLNEKAGHGSRRRVPTVIIDGEIHSVPSNSELAERLGV